MVSARATLQGKRVSLINAIRGYMLQEGYRLPEKFFQRSDWPERLEQAKVSETTRAIIGSLMRSIEALAECEGELTSRLLTIEDERLPLLESIPGIGSLTSRVILGALGDVSRFDDKKAVARYGALAPTVYQSGEVTHLGHINPDGRREVRQVLLQCAHTVSRMKSFGSRPLRQFYERIDRRRGKKIAVVALARKLMTIAYGVLNSGEYYDPVKLLPYAALRANGR